jgi:tRNA-specific 2-thiouridylase
MSDRVRAVDTSWISGNPPSEGTRLAAKTRYRQRNAVCVVARASPGEVELVFDEPQWAVTPGQSAVLYHGEASLGGGVIATASVSRLEARTAN